MCICFGVVEDCIALAFYRSASTTEQDYSKGFLRLYDIFYLVLCDRAVLLGSCNNTFKRENVEGQKYDSRLSSLHRLAKILHLSNVKVEQ